MVGLTLRCILSCLPAFLNLLSVSAFLLLLSVFCSLPCAWHGEIVPGKAMLSVGQIGSAGAVQQGAENAAAALTSARRIVGTRSLE